MFSLSPGPLVSLSGLNPLRHRSGEPSPLVRVVLEEAQRFVAKHWPGLAVPDQLD